MPKITAAFAEANGCDFGGNLPRPTRWDGFREFSCNRPHGDCGASAVVQCVGRWGHTWPLHNTHPFACSRAGVEPTASYRSPRHGQLRTAVPRC